MDSWAWIPGFGFLGLDSWAWSPGLGFLGLDSWVWNPGFGVLDLDSWIWTPGLNLNESPPKTYDLETEIANHEVPLTKPSEVHWGTRPKINFFLIALHKLARALQITLTWWGGLEEIRRDSFNIKPTRPLSKNPSR